MKAICVYCGSNAGSRPAYAERAAALGERIAREGLGLVYGGGNVGLMGLEPAREFAEDLRTQTLESLAIFGDSAHRLVELTNFITQRKF